MTAARASTEARRHVVQVDWRRDRQPAPDALGAPALAQAIRAEIAGSGPITFARFMERALYEPELGYYASSAQRTTRHGDFLTAPELHPLFGQALGLVADEMWRRMARPRHFVLREYGAGSGALFLAMLEGLIRVDSGLAAAIGYQPVELGLQSSLIRERLSAAGHAGLLEDEERDHALVGLVVANEFVDALPVHRVMAGADGLQELFVDWDDDRFIERPGPLSDDRLRAWFAQDAVLPEGHVAEVNLAMLEWLDEVATTLERGYVLIIDYGAGSRDLYSRERRTGTLRAFAGHHVSADALAQPGGRDITAHVNFDVLERHARRVGFDVLGRRRAAEFLIAAGLDEVYEAARAQADREWNSALELRAAVRRLLDPRALGGHQVTVLGKDVASEPALKALTDAP